MANTLFTAKVTLLPYVDADDSDYSVISLGRALLADTWRAKVEAVRAEKNPARQKALKNALPCFTPAGTFSHVGAGGLIQHSGFICVDIDAHDNTDVEDFASLKRKIAAVPFVAYCGLSCRGAGYLAIIPIADPAKHREYYKALQADFEKCGLTIDPQCKDVSRKRFVSWDADPYINTAARPYSYTLPERKHETRESLGHDLDASETAAKVEAVISACEANRWDITGLYRDWVRILSALAATFGDAGREYAHRISALYSGYSYEQTDAKYTNLLQHPEYKDGIGTFFYIARQEIGRHDFDNLSL